MSGAAYPGGASKGIADVLTESEEQGDAEVVRGNTALGVQDQILLQLKILTKHWEIANEEIITEQDIS